MLNFSSDYVNGMHKDILNKLIETNEEELIGYGMDKYSISAIDKIKKLCGDDVSVYFLTGGTQTNQIIISTMLKNYEGVIGVNTAHIEEHEAGAIEYTGHKVITINGVDGKLSSDDLNTYLTNFYNDPNHTHMVIPGMVYLSYPTEFGTLYTKEELTNIYNICKKYNIPLFIDGARLGYGLVSDECDITIKELTKLCDVFYIGGTKVGLICGEAVVFTHNNMPPYFSTQVKQHGAMLAKGRLLGVQMDALFDNDLYFKISRHAIIMKDELVKVFKEKNYKFYIDSPTNQQFIILDNKKLEELKEKVIFSIWMKYDDTHTVVRFATSWSSKKEDIEELSKLL